MKRTCLTALLAVSLTVGLSGCASLSPAHYYQLDSGTASVPKTKAGIAVQIRNLTIANYLQHDTLLQRHPDGSLTDSHARWAGSLAGDMQHVLLRQLAWRLDSNRVIVGEAPEGYKPELIVELEISRLDSGSEQPAVLDARWHLLNGNEKLKGSRMVHLQQNHDGTEVDQVKAQSLLIQQLAKQVANAIKTTEQAAKRSARSVARQARPQVAQEAEAPAQLPKVVPIRTGAEVYRF
jgi:uncharacterized lipoprotein YmbA